MSDFFKIILFFSCLAGCPLALSAQEDSSPEQASEHLYDKTPETQADAGTPSIEQPTEHTTADDTTATTDSPTTPKPISIERSSLDITAPAAANTLYTDDINRYMPAEKIQPMLAGPDDFITIFEPETTGNGKGVAILIPDWQQVATSPKAWNDLRKSLPNLGWNTILVQSPDKPLNYPSLHSNASEQRQENETIIANYKTRLSAMLTSVMSKASAYPGIFLVIAAGNNAALITELYEEGKNPPPSALVLLSSYRLSDEENQHFAQTLAKTDVPILDLYLTKDHPQTMNNAANRQTAANKQMKVFYRQKQLTSFVSGYYPPETLLVELNGWLKSIGW